MERFLLSEQRVEWSIPTCNGSVEKYGGTIKMAPRSNVKGTIDLTLSSLFCKEKNPCDFVECDNGGHVPIRTTKKIISGRLSNGEVVLIPDAVVDFNIITAQIAFVSKESSNIDISNFEGLFIHKASVCIPGMKHILLLNSIKEQDLSSSTPWYGESTEVDNSFFWYRSSEENYPELSLALRKQDQHYTIEGIYVSFTSLDSASYEQLMGEWVAPLQSFVSILTQSIESILSVDASISLEETGPSFACKIYGKSIVNLNTIPNQTRNTVTSCTPTELMRKFSSWKNHFQNHSALFGTYGTLMLSGESLARMRFLLIVESLENHYDLLYKNQEDECESEFQEKRKSALMLLERIKSNATNDDKAIVKFIEKNIFDHHRKSLQVKLKTLFTSLPNETIESLVALETVHFYSRNNNKDIDTVCTALGRIRNALSHGGNEIYRNDFPYLVNQIEGIAQYLMLCEIGFKGDEVSRALSFNGFPPLKEIKIPLQKLANGTEGKTSTPMED